MAVPVEADFRFMFPEMVDYDGNLVRTALIIAQSFADEIEWLPQDYSKALLYMTAHIALQLKKAADEAAKAGTTTGGGITEGTYIQSVHMADRSVSFRDFRGSRASETAGAGTKLGDLDETIYGQMYLLLRLRNIMPVLVV